MVDKLILDSTILESLTNGGLNNTHYHVSEIGDWEILQSASDEIRVGKRYIIPSGISTVSNTPTSCAIGDELHIVWENDGSNTFSINGVSIQSGSNSTSTSITCNSRFSIGLLCTSSNTLTVMYSTETIQYT